MANEPIVLTDQIIPPPALVRAGLEMLPAAIAAQGERAGRPFYRILYRRRFEYKCHYGMAYRCAQSASGSLG